jgi:hypothetical protein
MGDWLWQVLIVLTGATVPGVWFLPVETAQRDSEDQENKCCCSDWSEVVVTMHHQARKQVKQASALVDKAVMHDWSSVQ